MDLSYTAPRWFRGEPLACLPYSGIECAPAQSPVELSGDGKTSRPAYSPRPFPVTPARPAQKKSGAVSVPARRSRLNQQGDMKDRAAGRVSRAVATPTAERSGAIGNQGTATFKAAQTMAEAVPPAPAPKRRGEIK